MDITDQYIKMCEMAKKDLGWQPQRGDFYYDKGGAWGGKNWSSEPGIKVLGETDAMSLCFNGHYDKAIPLYRQDQLQESVQIESETAWGLVIRFYAWINWYIDAGYTMLGIDGSGEQLWLAFTMFQKFGKRWDGEKWGKSTSSD